MSCGRPSRVPEVNSREVPKWMEPEDIAAVVDGFARGRKLAVEAGCDGVEVNAGQYRLVRQFLSGLTNQRGDEWGGDRMRFVSDVLAAVRGAVGADHVVGLRLSCDELAPWAGITPEQAPALAAVALAAVVDHLIVVRGSIFSVSSTRPDGHTPPGSTSSSCRAIRRACPRDVPVVAQGSIVDVDQAEWALDDGIADAVEMTRAQISDGELVAKLAPVGPSASGRARCNQRSQVRDNRNPIITSLGDPYSGTRPRTTRTGGRAARPRDVLVVGAGPAGIEVHGWPRSEATASASSSGSVGGVAAVAGPGQPLVAWLDGECGGPT